MYSNKQLWRPRCRATVSSILLNTKYGLTQPSLRYVHNIIMAEDWSRTPSHGNTLNTLAFNLFADIFRGNDLRIKFERNTVITAMFVVKSIYLLFFLICLDNGRFDQFTSSELELSSILLVSIASLSRRGDGIIEDEATVSFGWIFSSVIVASWWERKQIIPIELWLSQFVMTAAKKRLPNLYLGWTPIWSTYLLVYLYYSQSLSKCRMCMMFSLNLSHSEYHPLIVRLVMLHLVGLELTMAVYCFRNPRRWCAVVARLSSDVLEPLFEYHKRQKIIDKCLADFDLSRYSHIRNTNTHQD